MLVLNRGVRESFIIGENIEVKVLSVTPVEKTGRFYVRIGIKAPREVPIRRSELEAQPKVEEPSGS